MGFDIPDEAIISIFHHFLLAASSKRECVNLCEVFSGVHFLLLTDGLYRSSSIDFIITARQCIIVHEHEISKKEVRE